MDATQGPNQANSNTYLILGVKFELDERYEVIDPVGSGAYGVVVAVRDKYTEKNLAVKKIEKAFDHSTFTK